MSEHVFEQHDRLASPGVAAMGAALASLGTPTGTGGAAVEPAELVDQIRRLEELKSAAAAAQARITAVFAAGQRATQRAAGVPERKLGQGVAAQVALARRDSPHRGSRHLGLAEALVHELPHTLAALTAGEISEWRATLVARETACLSAEHRGQVDAELAARPGGMGALGDRGIAVEARRIGYRLDPYAVTDRAAQASADRRVSLRPAPDTMTWLGALLPVDQGVAAYAALTHAADTARADGDDQRSRGQVMADILVERVTGQSTATAVPVEIHLVMTDQALLSGDNEPAEVPGVGPVPAPLVRRWLRGRNEDHGSENRCDGGGSNPGNVNADNGRVSDAAADVAEGAQVWVRRLYTSPTSGQLVAMDSRRRCFDGQLRRFVITADRTCRTPWCDAPIRHIDHALPAAAGGETSADNSAGLCEACNYAKEAEGWVTIAHPDRVVETMTPTGHTYTSRPPPPIGHTATPDRASPAA